MMAQAGKTSPLVTVIVATYNNAKTLKWALQSIQQQDFLNFEVRVIGDACADSSGDVVATLCDPRFHSKNLPQNTGNQSGPNNQGLKDARGTYIAYLGHDDLWFPWHLSNLLSSIEKNGADFAFSLCALFSPSGIQNPRGAEGPYQKKFQDRFTPPSSWLHKKDLIDDCGLWSSDVEKLRHHIDVEFWLKALRQNKIFHFCPALSVLKFPSPWWNSYKRKDNYPQEPFLAQLFNSPRELQIQILTDQVIHLNSQVKTWKEWILKQLRFYGVDRFPLPYLLRWYFQMSRRRAQLRRGLPLKSQNKST